MPLTKQNILFDKPDAPAWAQLLLAHGAGADMHSDFMAGIAQRFVAQGIAVTRFNFPYMAKRAIDGKRRPPDRFPTLQQAMIDIQAQLHLSLPLFVAGKSMGGRVAVTVADHLSAAGALVFGYPFHPIGKPDKLRLEPLQQAIAPLLVLQGTRDTMGSRELVSTLQIPASVSLRWFEDGDHSLKPRKRSGFDYADYLDTAVIEAVAFMRQRLAAA